MLSRIQLKIPKTFQDFRHNEQQIEFCVYVPPRWIEKAAALKWIWVFSRV